MLKYNRSSKSRYSKKHNSNKRNSNRRNSRRRNSNRRNSNKRSFRSRLRRRNSKKIYIGGGKLYRCVSKKPVGLRKEANEESGKINGYQAKTNKMYDIEEVVEGKNRNTYLKLADGKGYYPLFGINDNPLFKLVEPEEEEEPEEAAEDPEEEQEAAVANTEAKLKSLQTDLESSESNIVFKQFMELILRVQKDIGDLKIHKENVKRKFEMQTRDIGELTNRVWDLEHTLKSNAEHDSTAV